MAGVITLIRHGEPALSREVRLNAPEYREWWDRYEIGGLKSVQTPPNDIIALARGATVVVASTRLRAVKSATILAGDRPFTTDDLFVEAPLPPPPWPTWIRMGPRHWGFFARVWWWFLDHHGNQESVAQAHDRADVAARRLIALAADGDDVLLVAHGFFNTMVGRALKSMGWRRTLGRGYKYWSVRRFEKG